MAQCTVALLSGCGKAEVGAWTRCEISTPGIPVSIIVPARNEEANIERCVRSVLAQDHSNIQLLVLDDASTDQTLEILAQLHQESPFSIVTGDGSPLPEGWYGKPWALQRVQQSAVGEWLLFIDADVELSPQAVSRTLAYARDNELNMVTGLGFLEMKTFWKRCCSRLSGD